MPFEVLTMGRTCPSTRRSSAECASPRPRGVPDPADVVGELAKLDAELFVIVEQDL